MNELSMEALQQGSSEWHQLRSKMIGASDMPSIMGVGFKTPFELWCEKMGLSEQEENWAMAYGKEKEPEARAAYEAQTGEIMFPSVEISMEYPWAMASLDGINLERTRAVEIKNPGFEDHNNALKGKVPEKYIPQLQHQMLVVGLQSIDYWSYRDGKGTLITIKRDDEFIKKMLVAEQEFYQYLIDKVPPPLTERDLAEQGEEWQKKAKQYYDARDQRLTAETYEDQLRKELVNLSQSRSSRGGGYSFKKGYRKGAISYDVIPELVGVDLEKYRKPGSVFWTISKKKEEDGLDFD